MNKALNFLVIAAAMPVTGLIAQTPPGGETLQSVSDRGNITTNPIIVRNLSANNAIEFQNHLPIPNIQASNFDVNVAKSLCLNLYGGNVGIGTTSPAYKLDVSGSIHSPNMGDLVPSLYLGNNVISDNIYQIQFGQDDSNQLGMGYYTSSKSIWSRFGLGIHVRENAEFSIKSSGWKNLFGIQGGSGNAYFTGNVGIGTDNPTQKLSVAGTVLARKVKVSQPPSLDWPDYVFDSSYRLAPLHQLEAFIQKNKHLPDVPSAPDVKDNGLDLGDSQVVLLKKIEELTLYIIEQNKQLEKHREDAIMQKRINEDQKSHNAVLESRLATIEKLLAEFKK